VTGEACPTRLVKRWGQYYPQIPLVNAYGPTECSDDVTHAMLLPTTGIGTRSAPIGSPITNIQIYILDAQMRLLPIGVPGEIYVGGIGLGRGYLHDPVRTALAFVPNPFGGTRQKPGAEALRSSYDPTVPVRDGGERLYRTGDVGRYLHNGQIEFIGRIDQQVKLRGFRIELGEIEAALHSNATVQECVVVMREGRLDEKQLVAYVVPVQGKMTQNWLPDLRHFLQEQLPEYMIPAQFVVLESLPLTPNGKVDRHALPVAKQVQVSRNDTFVAPQTPLQEQLATIWAELLHVSQVGIHDHFFELGGHSLLATQVVSRIRRIGAAHDPYWGDLPLRSLFEHPTIATLASHLEELLRRAPFTDVPVEQVQGWRKASIGTSKRLL